MLEGLYVHYDSKISAKEIVKSWLMVNADGMDYTPENGVKLADMYPGFVDVSYLMNVWKEMLDNE